MSDEERVFIQNMSDKQILEIAAETMKEGSQNKDSSEESTAETKKIEKKASATEEDDWFTRVKDQWIEGKEQRREGRREARQQRRAERRAQDD